MPEPGHTPTGETTLPPPPVSGSNPAVGEAKAFFRKPAVAVEVLPPKPVPQQRPKPVPRKKRRPLRWWAGRLLPVGGLALFLGCLYALLNGLPVSDRLPVTVENGPVNFPPARLPAAGAPAVVIDPGHGGIDTGAIALGLQEKSLNLDVALRVNRYLEAHGIPVRMTRYTDQAVSLEERVRIANAAQGAIFVSIHFNDALSADRGQSYHATGVETYYSERKEAGSGGDWLWTSLFGGRNSGTAAQRDALAWSVRQGALLADAIQNALVGATSAADRGTKERGLYVTRRVRGPAVLVEGGFISHPLEAKHLGDSMYRQKLAEAIAGGIVKYLQASGRLPASASDGVSPAGA